MSREYKARDKKHHKMTRGGLVERNVVTGEEIRVSQRSQDFILSSDESELFVSGSHDTRHHETRDIKNKDHNKTTNRIKPDNATRYSKDAANTEQPGASRSTVYPANASQPPDMVKRKMISGRLERLRFESGLDKAPSEKAQQHGTKYQRQFAKSVSRPAESLPTEKNTVSTESELTKPDEIQPEEHPSLHNASAAKRRRPEATKGKLITRRPGSLHFESVTSEDAPATKMLQHGVNYQKRFIKDEIHHDESGGTKPSSPEKAMDAFHLDDSSQPADKPLMDDSSHPETAPSEPPPPGKKLVKAQYKAEQSAAKLESAKNKLPSKHSIKVERTFDADTGNPKCRLCFEKEIKSQRDHIKGSLPLRPVKAGANAAIGYAYQKVYQVEHENVGIEAAHKGELAAEGLVRETYRMYKTRPYRRISKLEQTASKRAVNYSYQMALHDNPKLKSSLLSQTVQKRKIKRRYAKAVRDARRSANQFQEQPIPQQRQQRRSLDLCAAILCLSVPYPLAYSCSSSWEAYSHPAQVWRAAVFHR